MLAFHLRPLTCCQSFNEEAAWRPTVSGKWIPTLVSAKRKSICSMSRQSTFQLTPSNLKFRTGIVRISFSLRSGLYKDSIFLPLVWNINCDLCPVRLWLRCVFGLFLLYFALPFLFSFSMPCKPNVPACLDFCAWYASTLCTDLSPIVWYPLLLQVFIVSPVLCVNDTFGKDRHTSILIFTTSITLKCKKKTPTLFWPYFKCQQVSYENDLKLLLV